MHQFGNRQIAAAVKADGAELCSLCGADGTEMLWQAGPEWPRHAPVLFPIVGRLPGDVLRHDGRSLRMTQHGFARDRRFEWLDRAADGCRLRLRDDADSRAIFPFRFTLEIDYRVAADALLVEYTVRNGDETALPFSLGAHPAFRWPLADGVPKDAHRLVFGHPEPEPIRRVENGLLLPAPEPTPVRDRVLVLDESLFARDAVILERPRSRSVRFEADHTRRSLTVSWHDMPLLGIWSKPGAAFLCIEPWHGLASARDVDQPFAAKPHLIHLAPGMDARLGWSVRLG